MLLEGQQRAQGAVGEGEGEGRLREQEMGIPTARPNRSIGTHPDNLGGRVSTFRWTTCPAVHAGTA